MSHEHPEANCLGKLENSTKILLGQVVLGLLIKTIFCKLGQGCSFVPLDQSWAVTPSGGIFERHKTRLCCVGLGFLGFPSLHESLLPHNRSLSILKGCSVWWYLWIHYTVFVHADQIAFLEEKTQCPSFWLSFNLIILPIEATTKL